jgi:hypothetical protein
MKPCSDCRHQISERAFVCPNCGAPFPAREPLSAARQRALLAAGLLSAAGADYYTYVILKAYHQIPAGADQYLATSELLLRFSPLLLALAPLAVLGVWQFWPKRAQRGIAAAVVGLTLFIFLPGFASSIVTSLAA